MAAKLLHSLTDENPDLQKQIGCMTGIFQIFDRQHIITGGRRIVGHSPERLPHGNSHLNTLERESNNAHLSSASTEKYSNNSNQEKQRISTESSSPSFSSLSRSSSFSSLDCNKATQLDHTSFDRIIFPETPSRDPSMSQQISATQSGHQHSHDLRDFVKDSMYRERTHPDPVETKQRMPSDIKESLRVLAKLREQNERPKELLRSLSYHAREGSSFSNLREGPRFSCDGRELISKNTPLKLKDLPRLSLDSRSVNGESKSNVVEQVPPGSHARPPSVVAKLMGLETLPNSFSSPNEEAVNVSRAFVEKDPIFPQVSSPSSSKNLWKEPISPRWRNPDSRMKPMARFPIEPAPWNQKPASRATARTAGKAPKTLPSVYSEIEKRLNDLEFTQSGKDLRALKQILEAMKSKGFLENEKDSNFTIHQDHEQKNLSSKSGNNNRKPHAEEVLASTKRRTFSSSSRKYESPIVIMKPAKLIQKSNHEMIDSRKGLSSGKMVNSVNMKNERTLKNMVTSTRPLSKDGNVGPVKSSGSISPRMQQKKLELEKRSRPPTSPDSSKFRRPSSKQQNESNSPGGIRRLKNLNVESNLNFQENGNSVESNSSMVKKSTLALSEEDSAEFACVPPEYSSPVSVLEDGVHTDDSPSPVKYVGKTLNVNISIDKEIDPNAVQASSPDIFISNSIESGPTSEINRKKLQNIENLVQKLRRLNSSHDEARTDYIASLCENTNPDHRYISEILLASGLLLRELNCTLTNLPFHPSGHPINPELFLVLEQTKASTEKTMVKEKLHRKLIFDTVNEILARKLAPFPEPMLRKRQSKQALNAQKLLRELCSEIEVIQAKNHECSSEEEDERWKNILCRDVMHEPGSWIDFDEEISSAVLDIERLIFKDLVNEILIGESNDLKMKPGRGRVFAK